MSSRYAVRSASAGCSSYRTIRSTFLHFRTWARRICASSRAAAGAVPFFARKSVVQVRSALIDQTVGVEVAGAGSGGMGPSVGRELWSPNGATVNSQGREPLDLIGLLSPEPQRGDRSAYPA